jgi:hypothetical protein
MGHAREQQLERITRYLQAGSFTEDEVRKELRLSKAEYSELRREAEQAAVHRMVGNNEQTYGAYALLKLGLIRDVDGLMSDAIDGNDVRSALMAVKVKGEVYDSMVRTAQSLGLVTTAPKRTESKHLSVLATMTGEDLLEQARLARSDMRRLELADPQEDFMSLPEPSVFTTTENDRDKERMAIELLEEDQEPVRRTKVTVDGQ